MVLADLGSRITSAIRSLNKAPVIDDEQLDLCLKEIATALLQSDVNVKFVAQIRSNIKNSFKLNDTLMASGNRQKIIQKS